MLHEIGANVSLGFAERRAPRMTKTYPASSKPHSLVLSFSNVVPLLARDAGMSKIILLDLLGGIALLLWGLHMVHSGVMRAFGGDLRRYLGSALNIYNSCSLPLRISIYPTWEMETAANSIGPTRQSRVCGKADIF